LPAPAWIVVPTYCEAETLPTLVAGLRAHAPDGTRVLVVDDASPDGTADLAARLGVDALRRPRKGGIAGAYKAGFAHALTAGAALVVQMDADLSHDPADVPRLLAAAEDADLVLGSRYVGGGAMAHRRPWRRLASHAACRYARVVLRVPVRDLTGGFKCWRADALRAVDAATARSQGYTFQVELTYRALLRRLRVTEVPIAFGERRAGRSKLSGWVALEAIWRVPALRVRARCNAAASPRTYYTF
jgi:dolichol-phosphate mannosyltransferase